jgi:hypothetical protein
MQMDQQMQQIPMNQMQQIPGMPPNMNGNNGMNGNQMGFNMNGNQMDPYANMNGNPMMGQNGMNGNPMMGPNANMMDPNNGMMQNMGGFGAPIIPVPVLAPPNSDQPCAIQIMGNVLSVKKTEETYKLTVESANGFTSTTEESTKTETTTTTTNGPPALNGAVVNQQLTQKSEFMFTEGGLIRHADTGLCMSVLPAGPLGLLDCAAQTISKWEVDFQRGTYVEVSSKKFLALQGQDLILREMQQQQQNVENMARFSTFVMLNKDAVPPPVAVAALPAPLTPMAISSNGMFMVAEMQQTNLVITTTTTPTLFQQQSWSITNEGYLMNMIHKQCVTRHEAGLVFSNCQETQLTKWTFKDNLFVEQGSNQCITFEQSKIVIKERTQIQQVQPTTIFSIKKEVITKVTRVETHVYTVKTQKAKSTINIRSNANFSNTGRYARETTQPSNPASQTIQPSNPAGGCVGPQCQVPQPQPQPRRKCYLRPVRLANVPMSGSTNVPLPGSGSTKQPY